MNRLSFFKVLVFICMFFIPYCAEAQIQLTSSANMFRCGDTIVRRQIEYFPSGDMGEGKEWDFRNINFLDDTHIVHFTCDSDSVYLYGIEPNRLRKYQIRNDSLFFYGYETRLQTVNYTVPISLFEFPYSYGTNTRQNFHNMGSYCKKYVLESYGTIETEADGIGKIYYNEDDTLENVLRIHRIYASGIRQYAPEDSLQDSLNLKQRIEEHYLWYAHGYRYPIFETISTTIYKDLIPISCQQVAYCTLPSEQLRLNDPANQKIRRSDSLQYVRPHLSLPIRYHVKASISSIDIFYELLADATIQALICDRIGVVYKRASTSGQSGENGHLLINTNSLRRGTYVLYLNINGIPRSEIIEIE